MDAELVFPTVSMAEVGAEVGAELDPEAAARAQAGALVEVLLPELVRTLTEGTRAGTVLGGRPHLRLFGEAIDLALPLRALRRASEAACGEWLFVDEDTLARHGAAIAAPAGYLLSTAGMHAADGPADAMSLRLYTSSFEHPMNALMRADPARPDTWLRAVAALRRAARRELAREELPPAHPLARRMARLGDSIEGLKHVEDPRLARVLGELLVHALMAVRALGRQPVHACEGWLRAGVMHEDTLGELRRAAAGESHGVWCDLGLLSAAPRAAAGRWSNRPMRTDVLEIRPLLHGSAGRRIDGSVDGVESRKSRVSFPPGTPFAVLEIEERPRDEGRPPCIVARLAERRASFAV